MVRLKVKWKVFYNQINDYKKEAENILSLEHKYCSIMDYDYIFSTTNSWIDKCYNYLQTSFDYSYNAYAVSFYEEKYYSLVQHGKNKSINEQLTEIFQDLAAKKSYLEHILRILSVSDVVIHYDFVDLESRESYSFNEIIELLFDKLFYLYDDSYYPINAILIGNGIKIKNYEVFFSQLIRYENEEYINLKNTGNICGKLTLKGKEFVEKKRKFDYLDTVPSKSEVEFIDPEQVDLFENIYNPEKCNDFMIKEIKELKLLNSIVFKNESNKLVILMIKEDIFYLNPA